MDLMDRIEGLERHVRLLQGENRDLIEENQILQNDKEALLRLVADLRERVAELETGDWRKAEGSNP